MQARCSHFVGSPNPAIPLAPAIFPSWRSTLFRALIIDQVIDFRDRAYAFSPVVSCAITGLPVSSPDAHVDHRPPDNFLTLMRRFLESQRLTMAELEVEPTWDGDTVSRLVNTTVAAAWQEFHGEHAVLQIVSKRANLSQGLGR